MTPCARGPTDVAMFGKARPRPKNNGAQWPIQARSNDDVPISEIGGNLMSPQTGMFERSAPHALVRFEPPVSERAPRRFSHIVADLSVYFSAGESGSSGRTTGKPLGNQFAQCGSLHLGRPRMVEIRFGQEQNLARHLEACQLLTREGAN